MRGMSQLIGPPDRPTCRRDVSHTSTGKKGPCTMKRTALHHRLLSALSLLAAALLVTVADVSRAHANAGFRYPSGVAVDRQGNIFVAESGRVVELSARGRVLRVWKAACDHAARGDLSGLAVDSKGNVYVADTLRNCVLKYSSRGRLLRGSAERSCLLGQPVSTPVVGRRLLAAGHHSSLAAPSVRPAVAARHVPAPAAQDRWLGPPSARLLPPAPREQASSRAALATPRLSTQSSMNNSG